MFQISTMAIQRASPTMISPVRYSRGFQQKYPGEREHQRRADDPVLQDRDAKQPPLSAQITQFFVFHLRQHRVHHPEQTHRNRERDGVDAQ
jgi:hypothetical protein